MIIVWSLYPSYTWIFVVYSCCFSSSSTNIVTHFIINVSFCFTGQCLRWGTMQGNDIGYYITISGITISGTNWILYAITSINKAISSEAASCRSTNKQSLEADAASPLSAYLCGAVVDSWTRGQVPITLILTSKVKFPLIPFLPVDHTYAPQMQTFATKRLATTQWNTLQKRLMQILCLSAHCFGLAVMVWHCSRSKFWE
jgi:hypothetical protein